MRTTKNMSDNRLPGQFGELVRMMPPQAIQDDVQYGNTLDVIDPLMAVSRATRGQRVYLETLVQLVQAYETRHHAIDTSDISGLDSLKHLLQENAVNASNLARLRGGHASLGSKILKGERSLTIDHIRTLAARFKVSPRLFLD